MKYIGIIAAMDEEINSIKELMNNIIIKKIYELEIIEGKINEKDIILIKCGIGKVNAARTTQLLIDNFEIEYIINVGTAGGLNPQIDIGDVVIGEKLLQHDFDKSAGGNKRGYISDSVLYFFSDAKLIKKAKNSMESINEDFNVYVGTIATGDIFVQDISVKNNIEKEFHADCVEMEGAAIAQVCALDKIPFIVIRGISDKPNGNNGIDFKKYLEMACRRYAKFVDIFLK